MALSLPSSAISAAALVFGGALAARWWYSSAIDDKSSILLDPQTGAPRHDRSKVTIALPKIKTGLNLSAADLIKGKQLEQNDDNTLDEKDGNDFVALIRVDQDKLKSFLSSRRNILQSQKTNARKRAKVILHHRLSEDAFSECRDRGVQQFSSWYFSYTTTYRLLSIAMTSAAKHVVTFSTKETLQQAVTRDLQLYIMEKYQAMVLRPAVTDPKVHRAIVNSLEDVYGAVYQPALAQLEEAMYKFANDNQSDAARQPTSSTASSPLSLPYDTVNIELDWRAQLQKAQHFPVAYEKNPPEFSVALIGASAMIGKVAGGTAAKAVSAKLAAPFVAKAVGSTLGGKMAAAGATAGGVLAGGPLGAGVGAAVGIGMDMAVNKGVSLMQRSSFERDVQESLDATLLEWEARIFPEVNRVVQEDWFFQLETMLNQQ